MTDASGEQVDLAHMCVTTLGYLNGLLIPDVWTGWAGDLASAMGDMKTVMEWNPGADLAAVCEALVGQGDVTIVPIPASGTLFLENTNVHHQRLVLRLIRLRSASPIP